MGRARRAVRGAWRAAALAAGRKQASLSACAPAGNDLARCLGWGAGMHVLREAGLPGALRDLEHAVPVPLDRWSVQVPLAVLLPAGLAAPACRARLTAGDAGPPHCACMRTSAGGPGSF